MQSQYTTRTASTPGQQTSIYSVYCDGEVIGTIVGRISSDIQNARPWRIASDFYSNYGEGSLAGETFGCSQWAIEAMIAHHQQLVSDRGWVRASLF